jgi:hypothetical protein
VRENVTTTEKKKTGKTGKNNGGNSIAIWREMHGKPATALPFFLLLFPLIIIVHHHTPSSHQP